MTRLINADKLKEAFENLASDDYNEPIWYQQTVFETIDNAPTVFFDWEKSDAYLDCVKRIMSLEKENEELRQFLKNQGGRQ